MAIFTGIAALVGTLATSIGGLFTLAGATSFILKTVVGIGLSLALNAIAGKKTPQQAGFGVQGKLAGGGDVPRSFLMGYSATAGSLVYAGAWGQDGKTPNAYFSQVIAISDMPVKGLVEFWVNGEKVTVLWNEARAEQGFPVEQYRKSGKDHCWIEFFDGSQTTASAFLVSKFGAAERPWASTRVGRGVAYAVVTSLVSDELWTGFPVFRFATSGMRLYDPSRDSSAGGTGDQRYHDPATWGGDGDDLPAVQIYNLLRGIRFADDWIYGLQGLPAARLPVAEWIAAIQKCRAPIAGIDATEPTYRSGGQFAVNTQLAEAVTALVTACHGRLAEIGGIYKLRCGEPSAAVVTIDDGMILSSSEQSFTPFLGLAQTINGIAARYPSPAEGWTNKVAPPLYRPDFEEADGDRRLMADLTFELVPYAAQVQRLMSSALEEGRRARRHTFVLPPEAFVLEPGDTVAWTSERNFYETKLFRVDGLIDRANLDVLVDLTEVDPSDYGPPAAGYLPVVEGPLVIGRPSAQAIVDWYAEPYDLLGSDGARRPGIRLSWDGDVDDVDWVEFEVRLATTVEVVHRGTTSQVAAGSIVITQSLLRGTAYEARGRYVAVSGRTTLWSSWLPVTTSDIRISQADLDARLQHIFDQVTTRAENTIRAALEELEARVERLAEAQVSTDASSLDQVETLKVATDSGFAAIDTEKSLRIEGDLAQAEVSTALAARLDDAETGLEGAASALSSLSSTVDAQGDQITATSAAVTALAAELDSVEGDVAATATAVSSLAATVSSQGGELSSVSSSVTGLQSSVAGLNGTVAGQSSAISSLQTSVTSINGTLTSYAAQFTSINTQIGDLSASGTFKMVASASPPAGAFAGIELMVKASAGGAFAYAGFEAYATPAGGGYVVLRGDRIYRRPSAGGTPVLMVDADGRFVGDAIGSGQVTGFYEFTRSEPGTDGAVGTGTTAGTAGNSPISSEYLGQLVIPANPGTISGGAPDSSYGALAVFINAMARNGPFGWGLGSAYPMTVAFRLRIDHSLGGSFYSEEGIIACSSGWTGSVAAYGFGGNPGTLSDIMAAPAGTYNVYLQYRFGPRTADGIAANPSAPSGLPLRISAKIVALVLKR